MLELIIQCPHCNLFVIIESINCGIFRHGVFKINGEGIPPHSPKEFCDTVFQKGEIWGCGKPFQILNNLEIKICDYI